MDSLNIGKGVSFDVIIAKENKQLLPRIYVTIEGVKYFVANLEKKILVLFMHQRTNCLQIMD